MAGEGLLPPPSPNRLLHTIFVDTSMDTHLALIVSLYDTISDVKEKIRAEHALCFQDMGEITIQAIKVRRRGFFYSLADSMYVLNAFDGIKGSWFVCVDAVPVCGMDTHKETVFNGLLPNIQDTVINTDNHEDQKLLDAPLKVLPAEGGSSLQNVRISPAQSLHACSTDLFTPLDRNTKSLNGTMANVAHLLEDVALPQCENEENAGLNGKRSHSPVATSIDHCHKSETLLIDEENGGRQSDRNCLRIESDVMPSSAHTHKTKSRKTSKKPKDGLHEVHVEDHSKLNKSEDNDKSIKSVKNLPPEVDCDGKTEAVAASSEKLLCKLPHENTISLQIPLLEKDRKKRKIKSSKLSGEDHLAMPCEIPVAPLSQVTVGPNNSGNSPTKLSSCKQLRNDDRGIISFAPETVNPVEVGNQNEVRCPMKKSLNEGTTELQNLQVDPNNRRKKHKNLGRETILHVNFKEPEKAIVSLQVTSPTKLSSGTGNFGNQSSKLSAPKQINDHQNMEFDTAKCITELNITGDEIKRVDTNAGISTKVPRTSRGSRKKSKSDPSKVFVSTELNVNGGHFSSDGAQVLPNEVQNDAAAFIEQADLKVDESRSVDTMIKKKLLSQTQGPHNMDKQSSASIKTAAEINAPSQPASEVQEKPRRSRRISNNELSKLRYSGVSDVALPKSNGEVTETIEGKGSDPSKLDNLSNQKTEQHFIDGKVKDPLSQKGFSTIGEVHHVNPLASSICKLQDSSGLSNAKTIIEKGDVAQHGVLASPIKSKSGRNKSKKKELEARVSSGLIERSELNRPDNSSLKCADYFGPEEGKHCPVVDTTNLPSKEAKARKKTNSSRKINIIQPCQGSPINLLQSSSHKQHKLTIQAQDSDAVEHRHNKVTSQTQDNDVGHRSYMVNASQDAATKDSKPGNSRKAKKTKKPIKQNSPFSSIEFDLSLQKAHEGQKRERELQDNGPQPHVQQSKSGDMQGNQEKKFDAGGDGLALDNGIVHYSPSPEEKSSSDGTKDTADHNSQYRVVRKIPSGRSKKTLKGSNPESLLDSSGRMFSDASGASSDSGFGSFERLAAIRTGLSVSGDSDSDLEKVQAKTNALEHQSATSSSESDRSKEVRKDGDGKDKGSSRPPVSSQKIPLSAIFKSSSSYKKARLTASQSEFINPGSQSADVVLETQPEPSP